MFYQIIFSLCLPLCILGGVKKSRIIGGMDANIKDYPYSASLRRASNNEHMCGGSIISNQHILTAAHCFGHTLLDQNDLKIYVGVSHLSESGPFYLPEKIILHPGFVGMIDFQTYFNDVAVVKVRGIIEFNQYQNKIKLPTKDVYTGGIGLLSGWGYTTYPSSSPSDRLKSTWMKIYESYHCRSFYSITIHIDQFCGFRSEGVGPCIGDSGSGFVSEGTVIGIVSISVPCVTGVPDVYTKVYSHLDFITTALASP